jgi:hypothetical protein
MIIIDEKFLVIKEINAYLVDMILINSFRSGYDIIVMGGADLFIFTVIGHHCQTFQQRCWFKYFLNI